MKRFGQLLPCSMLVLGLLQGCASSSVDQGAPYIKPASVATVELTGNEVLGPSSQEVTTENPDLQAMGHLHQACDDWFASNPRKIVHEVASISPPVVCHRGRFAVLIQHQNEEGEWKKESVSGTFRWVLGRQDALPIAELELRAGLAGQLGVVRQEGLLYTLTMSNGEAIQAFSWQALMNALLDELFAGMGLETQASHATQPGSVQVPVDALLAWFNHLEKGPLPSPWQWQDLGQRVRLSMHNATQKVRFDFMPLQLGYPAGFGEAIPAQPAAF